MCLKLLSCSSRATLFIFQLPFVFFLQVLLHVIFEISVVSDQIKIFASKIRFDLTKEPQTGPPVIQFALKATGSLYGSNGYILWT